MAENPKVYGPDGVLREKLIFSTSLGTRFVTGTIPEEAVDVQVSINGAGWSSDPNLIDWGDGEWTVPNPVSEPDGLVLLQGSNTVNVRAILPTGSTTPAAETTIRLVSAADIGVVASIPTNVNVTRQNTSVLLRAEPSDTDGFQGMNFYASLYSGGGANGYTRINVNRVSEGVAVEETEEFGSLSTDVSVDVDAEDNPVADPMFFRLIGRQEDEDETELQADFSETFEIPETARDLKIETTLYSVRDVTVYEFSHDRSAGTSSTPATVRVGDFSALPSESPLYYVVTAVYYDSTRNLEYESAYSEEVVGNPLSITTALGTFPSVSRQTIVQEFIKAVFRTNPQIKVEAGSVLRDTVIDPFSSESERIRFVLDFFHRARTPTLLLQIDDPDGTGTSVSVSQSPYKLALKAALYLSSSSDVQGVIDSAFEAYASNFGKTRRAGTFSAGEVTFYTSRRPTSTIVIPLGTVVSGGGAQFATTRAASIDFANLASFYDPVSGLYKVNVPVRAVVAGTSGNVAKGQVKTLVSSIAGSVSVVNSGDISGGKGSESNLDLVTRVRNALAGVDSGTSRGYLQTAADVPGVIKANVVIAGDPLMQRDLDTDGEHRGGKVDIWVQGSNISTVTDTFAFSFEIAQDIQFEVIGEPTNYLLRALDSELSSSDPIAEMLDNSDAGYELRNASTGEVFDLTDVEITTYNTIQLSTAVDQPALDLTDVVLGSYRRRTGSKFVLPRQPVQAITDVTGTVSGTLPTTAYTLNHPDSPLDSGRSTLAGDYLQIDGYTDDDGNTVPSGQTISVESEEHVLTGSYAEAVDNLGANFLTVRVWNEDKTVEYKGPNDPSEDPDFTISLGTQTTALTITRVETGDIPSGATVLVDYEHDENFTVTYTTNLAVSLTQSAVDTNKHATADVIAKEAIPIPLDIGGTIVLQKGRVKANVDSVLRKNFANFYSNLRLGDPVRQSDVIEVIENTDGVSYVVVPLSKLVPAENSSIVWESVSTDTAAESALLDLSTNKASVYILKNELAFATTDGAGPTGYFKGVFQDDIAMELLESASSLTALGVASGRTYVLGSEGRSIDGYSDDATLTAAGYTTASAIAARRLELTANRVLISLAVGSAPTSFEYKVTYVVGEDTGAKNIETNAVQHATEGTFTFTYDEDR